MVSGLKKFTDVKGICNYMYVYLQLSCKSSSGTTSNEGCLEFVYFRTQTAISESERDKLHCERWAAKKSSTGLHTTIRILRISFACLVRR